MSLTKSNISKNIALKALVSNRSAKNLLDKFIKVVISSSYTKKVKISGLGTFQRKSTPFRIGRNPKTGEEFNIPQRAKLNLVLSNKIKQKIN